MSWRRAKCDYITCLDSIFLGAGSRSFLYLLFYVNTVWPCLKALGAAKILITMATIGKHMLLHSKKC